MAPVCIWCGGIDLRTFFLVVTFILVLVGVAIARFPAGLAARMADLPARGITYERLSGTIWDGRMTGASYFGQDIGRIDFALRAENLLRLEMEYDVTLEGEAARGRARIAAGLDRRVTIEAAALDVIADRIAGLHPLLRQPDGRLEITVASLVLGPDFSCASASGTVRTNVLELAGRTYGWTAPALSGPIACEDGSIVAALEGRSAEAGIAAEGRLFAPQGRYSANVLVSGGDEQVRAMALQFGFVETGEGMAFSYPRAN